VAEMYKDGQSKSTNGRLKAIIVEDEVIVAEDLRNKLLDLGFNVIAVTGSGREAVECAKETHPDLVLMDFQIKSDLDGAEAAVVIQGMTDSPIPIVFLTAHSASEFPLLRAVSPYVYLRKPFSDSDLKRILDDAIKLRAPA
jgi:two-component system, response regulator PdtaR